MSGVWCIGITLKVAPNGAECPFFVPRCPVSPTCTKAESLCRHTLVSGLLRIGATCLLLWPQGVLFLFPRCSVSFSKVSYFSNLSALPPSLAAFSLFSQCCDGDDDGLGSDYGDEGDVDFGDDEGDVGDEDKQGNHVPGCLPHRCCHHPSRSEQKLVSP